MTELNKKEKTDNVGGGKEKGEKKTGGPDEYEEDSSDEEVCWFLMGMGLPTSILPVTLSV